MKRVVLASAPFAAYAGLSTLAGHARIEQLALTAVVALLAAGGQRSRSVLFALYPLALVGVVYDAVRPLAHVGLGPDRVLLCDLRALESRLFGWRTETGTWTLHDWFLLHHTPALDLVAAIPYVTYVPVSIACAVLLAFRDRHAATRFSYAFFLASIAGFITYHLVPAAPPWYFHDHGCALDLTAAASEGPALARVDELTGVSFFRGMYGKASTVFGAIPSLHCAYPLLVAIEGWRSLGTGLRIASIAYFVTMLFAAVYLDHHWVIDLLAGCIFALVAVAVVRVIMPVDAASTEAWRPRVARVVATWFGCGRSPIAPGTAGSLAALPVWLLVRGAGPLGVAGAGVSIGLAGVWAANIQLTKHHETDPQEIVVDEVAGVLVALIAAPPSAFGVITAIVLFRIFDITKPFPARAAERLPGGWGIVVDDVVAGVQAALVLVVLRAVGWLA